MKNSENNSLLKNFAKYTAFNVCGMMALSFYILVDTFFISLAMGADGLAALNFAIPVFSFVIGAGLMFGIGGATKFSILRSQNDADSANFAFTNTMFITVCVAIVFVVLGLFFSDNITMALRAPCAIFEMTRTYLQIVLLFAPVFMLNNSMLCFVRNDGAPGLAMLAMTCGSFANIILDYIFIIWLRWGMFGAALVTGISAGISLFIVCTFVLQKKNHFHLIKRKISSWFIRQIVSTGAPSLITELSSGVVIIMFNIIILGLLGSVGVAAYGIIANISLIVIAIYTGIAQGVQPLISSCHGSGNLDGVKRLLRYSAILLTALSTAVYCLVFIWNSQVVNIFNYEQNMLLQSIAETGIRIYFIGCLFAGFNIVISIFFTSTEKPRPAHVISVLRGFAIIIPMAFVLSELGGIIGVWSAFPATEFIVTVLAALLWIKRRSAN